MMLRDDRVLRTLALLLLDEVLLLVPLVVAAAAAEYVLPAALTQTEDVLRSSNSKKQVGCTVG
jgi:hypothetical protein